MGISKKGRKIGRNKSKCDRYRNEHRREKNKIVKLKAMIKKLSPKNKMRIQTEKDIDRLENIVIGSRI